MATRYWRGTTSTDFNNTANWSDTSGGATGFSVPGSGDGVIFDGNGNNPCTLDSTRQMWSISFASGYTSTFNFQGFGIRIRGNSGTVISLSANMTISGTAGSAYLELGNPGGAGTRTIVSNGKSLGNVSFRFDCGNTTDVNGVWRVWNLVWVGNNGTVTTTTGGSFEVQANFTGSGGSTSAQFLLTITMVGTGNISLSIFAVFTDLRINSTGAVTLGYMNFFGAFTNVTGFAGGGTLDCGVFTPVLGITTCTLSGFTNVPINTVRAGSWTIVLGSDLRVTNISSVSNSSLTISGAFKILVEGSVDFSLSDSSKGINSFNGSVLCLVGNDVVFTNMNQASINIHLEINTPGRVRFTLPNLVVLGASPTGYAHRTNGAITMVRGNVILPKLLCLLLTGSGGVVLRGMNKLKWGYVSFSSNVEYTFDEFFCGTPERPVIISGTYSIGFTTPTEKFTRFVNIGNATVTRRGQLIITTKGSRSNAVGVRYYNQSPNGILRKVVSIDDNITSVPSEDTHSMLMGDASFVTGL